MRRFPTPLGPVVALVVAAACAAPAPPGLDAAPADDRPTPEGRGAVRPNVIVLLTDDQRADALSAAGNPVLQTPAIDAIAEAGTRFENGFVTTSICAVSRASLLSGQYARRHQINGFAESFSPAQIADTYLARFEAAGYYTGFVGKWGIGGALPDTLVDVWRGFGGQGSYDARDDDGQPIHLTRLIERQAVQFLRDAAAQGAPFHLSVSFKAPHVEDPNRFPYDPAFESNYADVTVPPPADTAYYDTESLPAFGFAENPREEGRARWRARFSTDERYQASVKGYYRLVDGVDRAVAAIRAELDALGVADNTVVVFTSDNGFFLGEHGLAGKWYGHEESIRVPMIVYDPRAPASARGQVRGEMALNIDVGPTVLDLAGLAVPGGMQGRSLGPLVRGETPAGWRTEFFYEHLFGYDGRIPRTEGVVGERYKYLVYVDPDPPVETLFDTAADPGETDDLVPEAASDPALADVLDRMRRQWAAFCESLR